MSKRENVHREQCTAYIGYCVKEKSIKRSVSLLLGLLSSLLKVPLAFLVKKPVSEIYVKQPIDYTGFLTL